jgi:GT2 family glycosyltransferase
MKNTENHVSIILLTYNSVNDLPECIPSLLSQEYDNFEIIIVDNASSDETVEFIRNNYSQLKLIETGKNLGYPAGNNIGFEHARGKYVVVVNPDTVADPEWLKELILPLEEDSSISVTTPKIRIYYDMDKINTCGNIPHYTGLTFCRGLNTSADSCNLQEELGAISGCSFAIRREMLDYIKGFDADFFLYMEDADLSWRVRLAGGKIVYMPNSIIYHKFKLSIAAWKHFYLERNRYMMLLKNLDKKTLLLLLPGLIVSEIVTMGHALLNGPEYVKSKFKAYWWIFKNRAFVFEKRKKTLSVKKVSDKEFFELLEWKIPFEQVIENMLLRWSADKIFNTFFWLHYNGLKKIL